MARIDAAIAERAGQQLGLITRSHLDAMGVSRQQRRTLVTSGLLVPIAGPVLRHVAFPATRDQQLLAAAWCAGAGAAVSHLAAASVWRFDGIRPTAVEVSVPRPRDPRSVIGRVHRVSDLLPVDVTCAGLLPVTTPSRTLLDAAARLQVDQLEEALDGACRRGQIYLPYLEWRLAELRRNGRRGVTCIDELLARERRDAKSDSWLESQFLRVVRDGGLPPPRTQVTRRSGPGGRRIRVDAFYDEHKLVAEIDGHATHATRRQRQADAERDARLLALACG